MTKKLFVGNLPFSISPEEVHGLFAPYGMVESVKLVTDRDTGRPRGFGFVIMDEYGAQAAMEALDGRRLNGRNLRINEARERQPRQGGAPERSGNRAW